MNTMKSMFVLLVGISIFTYSIPDSVTIDLLLDLYMASENTSISATAPLPFPVAPDSSVPKVAPSIIEVTRSTLAPDDAQRSSLIIDLLRLAAYKDDRSMALDAFPIWIRGVHFPAGLEIREQIWDGRPQDYQPDCEEPLWARMTMLNCCQNVDGGQVGCIGRMLRGGKAPEGKVEDQAKGKAECIIDPSAPKTLLSRSIQHG